MRHANVKMSPILTFLVDFDKDAKTIQWGKEFFKQMVLR